MKTIKSILTVVFFTLIMAGSAIAQSDAKVIAVINKADWCGTCVKNGDRAMMAMMKGNMDGNVHFIKNDLTNDETKKKSMAVLKEFGFDKILSEYKGTGMVYFFDVESKKLINKISVAKSDDKLIEAVKMVSNM